METREEIIKRYEDIHEDLGRQYYIEGALSKGEFDRLHGQNWQALEDNLIKAGFIKPPEVPRDLAAEIDEIKERLDQLESS